MIVTKKGLVFSAFLGLAAIGPVAPADAQATLNDIGRMLQNQVAPQPGRQDPARERDAYERGRQDQAERMRRDQDDRRRDDAQRGGNDRRRYEDADRRQRDYDRDQEDARRRWADDQRSRQQGRY